MLALLVFIFSSSSLFLVFRALDKDRDPLQVILFNYLFCILFSLFSGFQDNSIHFASIPESSWLLPSLGLGLGFLLNFFLTQQSIEKMGLGVSSVANKLSLILPFFFTLLMNGKEPGFRALAGLLLCIPAIFLSSGNGKSTTSGSRAAYYKLLPLAIFLGTGLTDILTQWINENLLAPEEEAAFVLLVFSGAFLSAGLLSLYRILKGQMVLSFRNLLPGFLLGLPNIISYKSILAALNAFNHQGNLVFPVANLGVIVLTGLVSFFYFKDKLSARNLAGMGLALLALLLLLEV